MFRSCLFGLLFCAFAAPFLPAADDTGHIDLAVVRTEPQQIPADLTVRVRLRSIVPDEPTPIRWRYGGEGQGGEVIRGVFPKPDVAADAAEAAHALATGQWSAPLPLASFAKRFPEKFFLTVTAGNAGRVVDRITRRQEGYSRDVAFEFEFARGSQSLKKFTSSGPDGGTTTLVIPVYRLTPSAGPDSREFLHELGDVLQYARQRADWLESLPWASGPLPKKYAVINNISGYGTGHGYGIRTTDRAVTEAELRSLRQLGVNGFREGPEFLMERILAGDSAAEPFRRGLIAHVMGFPVGSYRPGRDEDPQVGCPFGDQVAAETERLVAESLHEALRWPVDEVWGLTVDEIGTVIDRTAEKKSHLAACPRCAAAFRDWLSEKGLHPKDFGVSAWSSVRPLDVWGDGEKTWLTDPNAARLAYYTRDFNNYITAKLFTPLRDAFARANEDKRSAQQQGNTDSAAARQPWIRSYALRGNTFLMQGHSLDFFDFYRSADNAIVYETSNREPRVWSWDSYLCDVQRVVGDRMNVARGIYIKPHRGAPVQRMLSAVSRGNTMIYWYTYGPDYWKGDSFSQDREALELTSRAAHLLGRAEDALYGSRWAVAAEIAVVKPETTQRWMNLSGNPPHLTAAWENAKWIYTALQHAHLPVDPLDERMLTELDLSRYKLIYVSGSHLTRAAAEALHRYVVGGGELYLSGWGLARDEANVPLDVFKPVLGSSGPLPLRALRAEDEPEMWYEVSLYGASSIEPYDDPRKQLAAVPDGAKIVGGREYPGEFTPIVGREILARDGLEVLARFADGRPAMARRSLGQGTVTIAAFFPGLEYSATVRRPDFNMRRDFDRARRLYIDGPALERTRPVVDVSDPLTEGVLLADADGRPTAVTLANWAYGVTAVEEDPTGRRRPVVRHLPLENVQISIPALAPLARATSCMLQRDLTVTQVADRYVIQLPRIDEGDVLILHAPARAEN
ncbi:MAG: hypothetical protein KJ000_32985 [Pirellulaceae bacterium]|nr:hypothetical protein [Pirellulaceae bacterium]